MLKNSEADISRGLSCL